MASQLLLKETHKDRRVACSPFDAHRNKEKPVVPSLFQHKRWSVVTHEALGAANDHDKIKELFPNCYGKPRVTFEPFSSSSPGGEQPSTPLRVGCVLSGGQAPGGHNVIAGLFDYVKNIHPESVVIGFLDGPHGIFTGRYIEVDAERMDLYRNTGGFDLLSSGRHKIETQEQFENSLKVCTALNLDGLVVIGGDDSNTNACLLAEYFQKMNSKCTVVGAPKTIDGDLRNKYIPISFGFDTACRTYAEQVSNTMVDALATQKYYHFVRLMGRAASNIALEVALQTQPNVCLISEEVERDKMSLAAISKQVADVIRKRAQKGMEYGVILLPEGLIEFIPEFSRLIQEMNDLMASDSSNSTEEALLKNLSGENKAVFEYVPHEIREQLCMDRDPHGNVQVAKIETEKLLALTVGQELCESSPDVAKNFKPQFASLGYEGRCAAPTRFDASYCYALGYTAGALMHHGLFGYMASCTQLEQATSQWTCGGVPITMMCHLERRHGKSKPVIKKALVELEGPAFGAFASQRDVWAEHDGYRVVGPVQFGHDSSEEVPLTVLYEAGARVPPFEVPKECLEFKSYGRSMQLRTASILGPAAQSRRGYSPNVSSALGLGKGVQAVIGETILVDDRAALPNLLASPSNLVTLTNSASPASRTTSAVTGPLKVGVVFFGRQAPGGHNVVTGLYSALKARNDGSELLGFFGGSGGLIAQSTLLITEELVHRFQNGGGFEMLGRTLDYPYYEHLSEATSGAVAACRDLGLTGLVLVGGHRTATGAANLAEALLSEKVNTSLVCVPCDVTGEFGNEYVGAPIGHDTVAKVCGSLVGNLAIDAASARKYWYFVKMFGGEASHLVVETALTTQPNAVLLNEEFIEKRLSLGDVVSRLADLVVARAESGKNFGVVLVPEGVIVSVPELRSLIKELDAIFAELERKKGEKITMQEALDRLTGWSGALLQSLPAFVQEQLLLPRQSDGKLSIESVDTEKLLATLVGIELKRRAALGNFGGKFSFVTDSIDYKARSSVPSNFDCDLAYSHGIAAASLVANGVHGYLTCISGLGLPASQWVSSAVPLVSLLNSDQSAASGDELKVCPTLVSMSTPEVEVLKSRRGAWELADAYCNPGPLQFGDDSRLQKYLHRGTDYLFELNKVDSSLKLLSKALRPGVHPDRLHVASGMIENILDLVVEKRVDAQSSIMSPSSEA